MGRKGRGTTKEVNPSQAARNFFDKELRLGHKVEVHRETFGLSPAEVSKRVRGKLQAGWKELGKEGQDESFRKAGVERRPRVGKKRLREEDEEEAAEEAEEWHSSFSLICRSMHFFHDLDFVATIFRLVQSLNKLCMERAGTNRFLCIRMCQHILVGKFNDSIEGVDSPAAFWLASQWPFQTCMMPHRSQTSCCCQWGKLF